MRVRLLVLIAALSMMPVFSACVSVRAHLAERPRVDQELPTGAEEQYPNRSKTRQVIVIEVDEKKKPEADLAEPAKSIDKKTAAGQSKIVTGAQETVVVHDRNFTFPNNTAQTLTQPTATPQTTVEEYTVQKDDTLQKIAKKLYGSYSKWTLIYDANREVIKDPNFLKPGKVLKIPVLNVVAPATPPETGETKTANP